MLIPLTNNTNIPVLEHPLNKESLYYQTTQTQAAFANINNNVAALQTAVNNIPPGLAFGSSIQPVAPTNSPGSGTNTVHDNHAHAGVHKINFSADALGDIVFAGTGVSQSGTTFTFSPDPTVWGYQEFTNPVANINCVSGTYLMTSNTNAV